jgi:uncharacterized membrane protein
MNKKNIVNAVMAAVLSVGVVATATAATDKQKNVEKCYGIVKAKMNDCGTPQHACAGTAKTNGDPQEWIYVMKGNCTRIVNGSLTAGK